MNFEANSLEIEVTTLDISRIDIYADGRPVDPQKVADGNNIITTNESDSAKIVKILGFEGNELVAARNVVP